MTHQIELGGVSVVAIGAFNPAIFTPWWLAEKELLPREAVEAAAEQGVLTDFVTVRQLASFTVDWLSVQVTLEQAVFSTVEEGRELDLRDLVISVWDYLPETPVDAVGINADAHFRLDSEEAWHAIGDLFLPKDFWQPLFEGDQWQRRPNGMSVGMREMIVESHRTDTAGYLRAEIAPSVRLQPNGVYTGVNAHFQLTGEEGRGSGYQTARTIDDQWDGSRAFAAELIRHVTEVA